MKRDGSGGERKEKKISCNSSPDGILIEKKKKKKKEKRELVELTF